MNQSELFTRATHLVRQELLGPGWSASTDEHGGSVTLTGPDHHLLVLAVESVGRPGCPDRIAVRGSFGGIPVPQGVRPHPTIYLSPAKTERQWANEIRRRLLGSGSRGKNYTATLAALVALHEQATAASAATAAKRNAVGTDPVSISGAVETNPVVRVGDPGELIASVPAMLGFPPERSLVVLLLRAVPGPPRGTVIDAIMRLDLEHDSGRARLRAATVARCVAQASAHLPMSNVLAVVVDDRAVDPALPSSGAGKGWSEGRFEVLIADLARRLAAHEIGLAGAWAVRAIEPQQRWWSVLGTDQRGALPDPAATALAKSHLRDGRPICGSRAELTARVAEDVELQAEVAAVLDSALAVARDQYARAVGRGDPNAYSRQALQYVLWQLASVKSGYQLMVPELAELAAALRDRSVRDSMFALAVGDHATAAEDLFAALARALSGRDRAEAAALLGYSAYIRGDGPVAGVALAAALTADPEHPLALLLERSLSLGMRPEQMRRLARSGFETAADLGMDLGEPAP